MVLPASRFMLHWCTTTNKTAVIPPF